MINFGLNVCKALEFLSQKKSGVVLTESTNEEDQTNKQALCHRKRSDKKLITYAQYVLGSAASEEF